MPRKYTVQCHEIFFSKHTLKCFAFAEIFIINGSVGGLDIVSSEVHLTYVKAMLEIKKIIKIVAMLETMPML